MKISEYYEEKQVREFENTSGRDNILINGNFDIWQRGTSFAAIATASYSADRFFNWHTGSMVFTLSRDTDVPTQAKSGLQSNYSLKLDCTTIDAAIAAGDFALVGQKIEGYDFAPFVGKTATLSFWVKAVKTGIYCVSFGNSVSDRSHISEYTINTASTWEKKTITLDFDYTGGTWDYTNGKGLQINWAIAIGSTFQTTADAWQTGNFLGTVNQVNGVDSTDNNFWLAQVKLEEGSVATPFVPRPIGEELALCQRYFELISAGDLAKANTTTDFKTASNFKVTKRVIPTMALLETTLRYFEFGVANRDSSGSVLSNSDGTTVRTGMTLINGFSGLTAGNIAITGGTVASLTADILSADAEL